jgi:hypothetical protein
MDAQAPPPQQQPGAYRWWVIRGLTTKMIETRCAPRANLGHFRMIHRLKVRVRLMLHPHPADPTAEYVYKYQSQRDLARGPYQVTIAHTTHRGLLGHCTCPYFPKAQAEAEAAAAEAAVVRAEAPFVAALPPTGPQHDWCKHLCGVALDLVDPALMVRTRAD